MASELQRSFVFSSIFLGEGKKTGLFPRQYTPGARFHLEDTPR